jgi:hypothetical protein
MLVYPARGLRGAAGVNVPTTNPPRSDQPRPIRVDEPMDCMAVKSRNEEWPRPLEPARRKRNIGAVRLARRPNVSLIWLANQIAKPARTRDRRRKKKSTATYARTAKA